MVPVTGRTSRVQMLNNAPTTAAINEYFMDAPGIRRPRATTCTDRLTLRAGAYPAKDILEFARVSKHVRDIEETGACISSVCELIAHRTALMPAAQLKHMVGTIHPERIRTGRVRVDAVAMLVFRRFFARMLQEGEPMDFYLHTDASPQWRGRELFASSFDMRLGDTFMYRMLPLIQATFGLTLKAKTMYLLWQIFLQVGPSFSNMAAFCDRVVSITTDMGVESGIAEAEWCFREFRELIGSKDRLDTSNQATRLFRFALRIHGWNHCWDTVLRRGLCSLHWFPVWLKRLKAIIGFIRNDDTLR